MASVYAVGNDGNVTFPTTHYQVNAKVWAATLQYTSTETTGFSHTGKTRRLGIADITGSIGGGVVVGAGGAGSSPFGALTSNVPTAQGGTLTLWSYTPTAGTTTTFSTSLTNYAAIQFDAVFNSFAFNSDKNGDHTLSLNFEMNDSNGPTVVWATSLP